MIIGDLYNWASFDPDGVQEEGWVVCRVFKKRMATVRRMGEYDSPCWYDEQVSFMHDLDFPNPNISRPYSSSSYHHSQHQHYPCKQELEHLQYNINLNHHDAAAAFLQLPQLESPKVPPPPHHHHQSVPYGYDNSSNGSALQSSSSFSQEEPRNFQHCQQQQALQLLYGNNNNNNDRAVDPQVTDWRVLDKFVASQLSHDDQDAGGSKETVNYSSNNIMAEQISMLANGSKKMGTIGGHQEYDASTSTSSCHIDLCVCEDIIASLSTMHAWYIWCLLCGIVQQLPEQTQWERMT